MEVAVDEIALALNGAVSEEYAPWTGLGTVDTCPLVPPVFPALTCPDSCEPVWRIPSAHCELAERGLSNQVLRWKGRTTALPAGRSLTTTVMLDHPQSHEQRRCWS